MDSLLASYASSDEEEDQPKSNPPQQSQPSTTRPCFSLPKPLFSSSSSSLFSSLPPPKPSSLSLNKQQPSSLFSSLPSPKLLSDPTPDLPSLPQPTHTKRVVQFHPPLPQPPSSFDDDDDDDDDDEGEKNKKKQAQIVQDTSVKSFLSSMPTPKNSGTCSLGALPSALGSGRRSTLETQGPDTVNEVVSAELDLGSNADNFNYQEYDGYVDASVYYDNSNWYNASSYGDVGSTAVPSGVDSFASLSGNGKRRRDQPPTEIVEVNQDELMKNRPTEDKSKLTGIAFGPSYQPVSTKGKPSKLHKRKHQIGSLYFDMKQKEMELQERRARGFLTKAETHAKYGW